MRTIYELSVAELNDMLSLFPKYDAEYDADEDSAVSSMIKKMGITKSQYCEARKLIKSHRDNSGEQVAGVASKIATKEAFAIFKYIATDDINKAAS